MERPQNFRLDPKSLCSSCNSYVLGEHQLWCETRRQKPQRPALPPLLQYVAFDEELQAIERVAQRLFSEKRLKNGDEYRDLAQQLFEAVRRIRELKAE